MHKNSSHYTVSIFSVDQVSSSNGDFINVWLPDPNIEYFTGGHIVLFLIAFLFLLFFILPFVLCFIFLRLVLWSRRLSYWMLDCFLAPYKDKYRYWFGLRALVLLYLLAMEAIIFSSREALSIAVFGFFALLQAYLEKYTGGCCWPNLHGNLSAPSCSGLMVLKKWQFLAMWVLSFS